LAHVAGEKKGKGRLSGKGRPKKKERGVVFVSYPGDLYPLLAGRKGGYQVEGRRKKEVNEPAKGVNWGGGELPAASEKVSQKRGGERHEDEKKRPFSPCPGCRGMFQGGALWSSRGRRDCREKKGADLAGQLERRLGKKENALQSCPLGKTGAPSTARKTSPRQHGGEKELWPFGRGVPGEEKSGAMEEGGTREKKKEDPCRCDNLREKVGSPGEKKKILYRFKNRSRQRGRPGKQMKKTPTTYRGALREAASPEKGLQCSPKNQNKEAPRKGGQRGKLEQGRG